MSTPETNIDEWFDKESSRVVEDLVSQMQYDHAEERTHDDSQEIFEKRIEDALRRAYGLGLTSSGKTLEVQPSSAEQAGPALDLLRDILFAVRSKAPTQHVDALLQKASDFYWKMRPGE